MILLPPIWEIIAAYIIEMRTRVRPEILEDQLSIDRLCANPAAVEYLIANHTLDELNWSELSANPTAMCLLRVHENFADYTALSYNPAAIDMLFRNGAPARGTYRMALLTNPACVDLVVPSSSNITSRSEWSSYSRNPAAIDVLAESPECIDWQALSYNPGDGVEDLLRKHIDKVDWKGVSKNPSAIGLLLGNPRKIVLSTLCGNPHPEAIKIIRKHIDDNGCAVNEGPNNIDNSMLSENPAAIDILLEHPDIIDYESISANPAIFIPDTELHAKNIAGYVASIAIMLG